MSLGNDARKNELMGYDKLTNLVNSFGFFFECVRFLFQKDFTENLLAKSRFNRNI